MATKAKKAPRAPSKPAAKAAAADQSCPAEGMEAAPAPRNAPHPQVKGGPAPYLMVDGAVKAAEFYKRAFGAEEVARHPPDAKGRTMHIHLYVNGGSVMLSDAYPEHGHPWKEPQGFNLHLQVDDVDAWWKRAIAAGAESRMPVQLMFWGDR
jgi:PhnB protein